MQEPAKRELGSTVRLYTFAVSAAVLAASAVIGEEGPEPQSHLGCFEACVS